MLLYGLAVAYGLTGQTNLRAVGAALSERSPSEPAVLLALVLLVAGFALMLAFVPFHWWLAESFAGAPLPALAFVASVGIGAAFAVFGRLMQSAFAPTSVGFATVLAVLAAVTAGPDTTAQKLGSVDTGTIVAVTGGPVVADGYTWWEVTQPIREWGPVSFVERGVTPAEELLQNYDGPWHGSVEPAFEEQEAGVSKQ